MPNSQLQGKSYKVDSDQIKYLGTDISYDALKMKISRLNKAKQGQSTDEFNRLGGDTTLK